MDIMAKFICKNGYVIPHEVKNESIVAPAVKLSFFSYFELIKNIISEEGKETIHGAV